MFRSLLLACFLATLAIAQTSTPSGPGLPPLIDRELLFGNPEIALAQVSPDGRYLAFVKPYRGTLNIWVKPVDEPFSSAHLVTAEPRRPVTTYVWTRDSKFICYVKDNDGDENFNLFAVDPAMKAPEGVAPPPRDLTGLRGVAVQLYSAPRTDPDTIYIGVNDRDKAWHDLYRVTISTGQKLLIRQNTERIASWFFDPQGRLRLALRTANNGDTEILRVDQNGFTKVYSCSVFESCAPVRYHKDGKRVYLATNKGDTVDLTTLVLFDPETGKSEVVESDPMKRVDLSGATFSEASDELIFTSYVDDRLRRYFKDKNFEADFKWLESKLPGREIAMGSRTHDEQMWLVSARSDVEPGETYLFDRKDRKLTLQYRIFEKLPREALVPLESVTYRSSDGLEISAYLALPKGMPAKNLPTLVVPHGGPWARDSWGYNPLAQFLANRGYAVLMPNFRGSTGYGKKFLNAGNGEWGKKMQDDLTFGVKYLIARGTSDPKRIGIMGGSYGGYATLAGLAFTPDVYRAAVDIVGPSNLNTLLDSIPAYWEAGRKSMYTRMADPGTAEGKAWLKERSPLTQADKIKAALMVVQGANDPRVNKAEAEQIVVALRDRGFPVEYLMAPDEGHGFARPVNNMALFMAAERFLSRHLDGRYQEGGSPEVVKRLAEITVDPKTVTVTKRVDVSTVGLPKVERDLTPGTFHYQTKLSLRGQEQTIKMSTTIAEENGAWSAVDATELPMGNATDSAILEKGTLVVRKRSLKQGPVSIEVNFNGNKAEGKMTNNGQEHAISAETGGALFADAAASMQVLGCLPLALGYSLDYRNFDVQRQKVKLMHLSVAGQENVTVPAGTFDAFKVEVSSPDAGTDKAVIWIDKTSRRVVKVSTAAAALGGATMVTELMP